MRAQFFFGFAFQSSTKNFVKLKMNADLVCSGEINEPHSDAAWVALATRSAETCGLTLQVLGPQGGEEEGPRSCGGDPVMCVGVFA